VWGRGGGSESKAQLVVELGSKCTAVVSSATAPPTKSLRTCLNGVNLSTCMTQGGTASASPYFNDRNFEEPANYRQDDSACSYLVQLGRKSDALQKGQLLSPVPGSLMSLPGL
jgi:hypothetical protein